MDNANKTPRNITRAAEEAGRAAHEAALTTSPRCYERAAAAYVAAYVRSAPGLNENQAWVAWAALVGAV
jgi:hypothetical protein